MTRTVVAGVDSSTQSCKIVRVDAETGEVLSKTVAPHPDGTAVDPERWWDAFRQAGGEDLDDAAAVSVSAQQHGMVALDGAGVPVHEALLWNDVRSAAQAERLRREIGPDNWAREVGVVPVSSFTITKLAWLAEVRPELAARVRQVLLPHDWLTWRLTGRADTPVTDRSDASGTGYWSVPEGRYREDLLAHAFGRVPELPVVLDSAAAAGRTRAGALVAAGCGDNAGAALGLGLQPGEVAVSIGTSGTVFASTDRTVTDPSGMVAGFADASGRNLPLLATINGARILASTAELLGVDLDELDRLAASAEPDAGGLTMIPYFDGERTPNLPHARASLTGMSRANMSRANMARAAVLGLLCHLAEALDVLRAQGIPTRRVLLIGGGARSLTLRSAAADIFQTEVVVPVPGEYVALGAARQAAWALAGTDAPPTWQRRVESAFAPDPSADWAQQVRADYRAARAGFYGA